MAKEGKHDPLADIPHERIEPRPDFSKPPPARRLPKVLEDTLESEEKMWEVLYDGKAQPTTNSDLRYAAYATRIRTILVSAQRYVAYTSDIGESFRPVAHPYLIKGAYAVSWLYLAGDVGHEGYKAYIRNQKTLQPEDSTETGGDIAVGNAKAALSSGTAAAGMAAAKDLVKPAKVAPLEDYRTVMAQRAIFQSVASMGLPAFTIHSIVKYSGKALKDAKNRNIRSYGPIGLGLAAVPALPFLFDKPVEEAVEWIFHKAFASIGGTAAVDSAAHAAKEKKEL